MSFNPCVGRNSSGAPPGRRPLRPAPTVSIRVLVGIAQEPIGRAFLRFDPLHLVSIRVLVGIAQEHKLKKMAYVTHTGFNPCVGRNSSGAPPSAIRPSLPISFQSVCWSE